MYTVPFKNINNKDCLITIGSTGSIELTAGGDPIKIDIDQSDLLAPIRSSTATIAVYGSDYLQDLYTSNSQGVPVTLYIDGAVKWLGYLLPDTFSQDFSSPEFIYEMEAVAAISTLKYKKFDLTDDFVTFKQIILRAMVLAGYKAVWLTNSIHTSAGEFYDLKISSSNFFDELGEAMTYYEVLEEIAKYVGCCFVPYEDELYLIDYAAIIKGYNCYTKMYYAGEEIVELKNLTLIDDKIVENYKGTGAKLSRIAGKNKATIRCSLYEIDKLFPKFDDEGSSFVCMETDDAIAIIGKEETVYREIRRYYDSPKFELYGYTFNGSGHIVNQYINNEGKLPPQGLGSQFIRSAMYDTNNKPVQLSFKNEILVNRVYYTDRPVASLDNTHPILKLKSDRSVLMHGEVYLCISMSVMVDYAKFRMNFPEIPPVIAESDKAYDLWLKLKIGNKYYDGIHWTFTESRFSVPITVKKGQQLHGQEHYFSIDNTNTFELGIGDLTGFIIKAPDGMTMGNCELTIYAFDSFRKDYPYDLFDRFVRYKDINISYGIPNEQSIYGDWVSKDSKNDALYENVIEGDFIDEADTIDLKICSNTDGKLALSSVIEGNSFLKTLTADAYRTDLPEHLLLERVTDMFKAPRFQINPTLEANAKPYTLYTEPHLNRQFLVAGGEIDVKMESATYNLIEL